MVVIFLTENWCFRSFEIELSPNWKTKKTKTRRRKIWRKTWRQNWRNRRSKGSNGLVVQLVDRSASRKPKSGRGYSKGSISYGPYIRIKIHDSSIMSHCLWLINYDSSIMTHHIRLIIFLENRWIYRWSRCQFRSLDQCQGIDQYDWTDHSACSKM